MRFIRLGSRRWAWPVIGCVLVAVVAVALIAPRAIASAHRHTTGTAPAPAAAVAVGVVAQQMQTAIDAASPGTQVGVDVVDTTTGQVVTSVNADQQFYTASVVKLLIAVDDLKTLNWQPDTANSALVGQMLSASDDDIADGMWDTNGGDAIVSRMVSLMGLSNTTPPADPDEWGETLTTPQDVVKIYHYITNSVPEPSRDIILNALRNADQIAADGTNQYFGIPNGLPGTTWAIKQGWMILDDSTTLDTTGLVGTSAQPQRYAVVVLTTQPANTTVDAGGAALTAGLAPLRPVTSSFQ